MPDGSRQSERVERRRLPPLASALVLSLALHAVAGSLLLRGWQRAPVKPPAAVFKFEIAVLPPTLEISRLQPGRILMTRVEHGRAVLPAPYPSAVPVAVSVGGNGATLPAAAVPSISENIAPAPAVIARESAAFDAPERGGRGGSPRLAIGYVNKPQPVYPPLARKLGLEGLVMLRAQVTAAGVPERVIVAKTSGAPELDEAALRAVQDSTFIPAPVAHEIEVPIRFRLKN